MGGKQKKTCFAWGKTGNKHLKFLPPIIPVKPESFSDDGHFAEYPGPLPQKKVGHALSLRE